MDEGSNTLASEETSVGVTPEDIEATRANMSGTIAAIVEKVNPHVIAEEAKDVAIDATRHARDGQGARHCFSRYRLVPADIAG